MRLKKSQIFVFVLVILTVASTYLWYISKLETSVYTETIELSDVNEHTSQFYDRKNKSISSSSPGLSILLTELENDQSLGKTVLSIDSELQELVYAALEKVAFEKEYAGGAGVIMDIETGELLSITSYSADEPVAHNATEGLFIPGSIIKPFIALAALSEDTVDPAKEILSTGSIALTDRNGERLLFNDWATHGYVDMRKAIGVSSNVYFYAIGGGYENQSGLGIDTINEYLSLFEIGNPTGIAELREADGRIPTPAWKAETFNGDEWRLADTYLASIGQHGYEVTPLQMTRAVAAIATEGELVTPTLLHQTQSSSGTRIPIDAEHFEIVKEGMEYAVTNGTAAGLYMDDVTLAAKTGTAEADSHKKHIHSWLIGYFPYDEPRYAFTLMLDHGPWGEETGAVSVASEIFAWLREHRSEYLTSQ